MALFVTIHRPLISADYSLQDITQDKFYVW